MTLRDYLKIARRWWWLVILGTVVAGAVAFLVTAQMTRIYEARAVLLVNQGEDPSRTLTYNDILGSQSLTKTYAQLVTSNIHLKRSSQELKDISVPDLEDKVRAQSVPETQLIEVFAQDRSRERAALIANTVARTFPAYILEAQQGVGGPNRVVVARDATAPEHAVKPNRTLNILLGVILGLLLSIAVIALVEYLDDGLDGREDLQRFDVSFLGSVLQAVPPKGVDKRTWVPAMVQEDPRSELAESYRQVQANLAFALSAIECKLLLVTSPNQGEGKSTTAANLAEALSESSRRVLLIDGDLRKPDAHRYFSLPNASGLTSTFLVERSAVSSFPAKVSDTLSVLTGGPVPPNPTELLSSARLKATLETLAADYDVIIIDSPPMLGLADASIWMTLVDGVLVVVRRGKTRRNALDETLQNVRASRKPLVGVVLNGVKRRRRTAYEYRYSADYVPSSTEPQP